MEDLDAEVLGNKAVGLATMARLGLPVPPAFVVTTPVGRHFLRHGALAGDVAAAIREQLHALERVTGRRLGDPRAPLLVAVRSGAAVSMPGMMDTVVNLGALPVQAALEAAPSAFHVDTRFRFLRSYATTVAGVDEAVFADLERRHAAGRQGATRPDALLGAVEEQLDRAGHAIPEDPVEQVERAVAAVLGSWHSPRAHAYRQRQDIPHDLGTAAVVQAMVFGNRDADSATGVAFSRDPTTGHRAPYGDVLFTAQGEDVVSGRADTGRLSALAERLPDAWDTLLDALALLERELRDLVHVEFTIESGRLWLLQVRVGGATARAAIKIAVELVDEGRIGTTEALRRITPEQVRVSAAAARASHDGERVLTAGLGASPGVATGRIATTSEEAIRLARTGPVVLVRPVTSPRDMPGIAAAVGVLTAAGGLTSHAAVVARSLSKAAVVGAAGIAIDAGAGTVTVGPTVLRTGDVVSIDGTSGAVFVGDVRARADGVDPHLQRLLRWADDLAGGSGRSRSPAARLAAAHARLGAG
ncbi:pyruvate, phosphate dikinase [Egicoccus sp. AB-alg2]|uniref:pyruvate, phosphate dikinase n=1 Tax=Egicoccus sp. AB-alg2 TaxID=3242693 RepID=UPI00359EF877